MPANGRWDLIRRLKVNDLSSTLNIVRVIKSKKRSWMSSLARVEERNACRVRWGYLTERDHLEDLDIDWGIILK